MTGRLTVAGTGMAKNQVTLEALECMRQAEKIALRRRSFGLGEGAECDR